MKRQTSASIELDTIRSTADYSLFNMHSSQRLIRPAKIKKIMASMKKHGFFPNAPIGVIRSDAGFLIVDGHHRFTAAKACGIPVLYVLLEKKLEKAVADMSTGGGGWNSTDFLRDYVMKGLPHYLTLNKYVVAGIPLIVAAAMLGGQGAGSGSNFTDAICNGSFTVRDVNQCDAVLSFIREFKEICPAVKSLNFIRAFSLCYMTPEFNVEQFRQRLHANPRALAKAATYHQMLDQMEEIYNFRSRIMMPLAFRAKEAAAARSIVKVKEAA